jgi:hypothetical protein
MNNTMKSEFGFTREELTQVFQKFGDRIDVHRDIHYIMRGSLPIVIVESAYSGFNFSWTPATLKKLEKQLKLKVKIHGGQYCRVAIELTPRKTRKT